MKKIKSKKFKPLKARIKIDEVDPNRFTIFNLKPDWESNVRRLDRL